uniref:Transmembrane protein n=1 Tax=Anopheles farauti TaxID=69004 RepID=A0A182QYZ4_9DIPT
MGGGGILSIHTPKPYAQFNVRFHRAKMVSCLGKCSLLLVSVSMLFALTNAAGDDGDLQRDINRGSLMRVARSAQQPQGFPNFPPPQFPFANPEIVSQDTQEHKNGFTQTTIYKYPNGMGSSSVSTSYSGSPKQTGFTWSIVGAIALMLLKLAY